MGSAEKNFGMEITMLYTEAIQYLYNIPRFSKKTSEENSRKILELLGNPQRQIKVFHVAGSNGKGSVCAFLNSILVNAGFKTGLFTSPHLIKPNERIKINSKSIDDDRFIYAFNMVYSTVTENEKNGIVHPSFFEFIFLMALIVFKEEGVEYGIMEVGLGGRLDATNLLENPIASVITSIGLEHTEILGDTIEKIAWEKAGIIRENVPVIYDRSNKEAAAVIEAVAREKHTVAYGISYENIKIRKKEDKYIDFSLNTSYYGNDVLRVPFPAPYQTINASLAVAAMVVASQNAKDLMIITKTHIRTGIEKTRWEGRMECVADNIYIDGAHNISGVERFIEAQCCINPTGEKILLFSVVTDKNYDGMIKHLVKNQEWKTVYIAGIDTARGADLQGLKEIFEKYGSKNILVFAKADEAFRRAAEDKRDGETLFCVGSLYLAGEIKKYIQDSWQIK